MSLSVFGERLVLELVALRLVLELVLALEPVLVVRQLLPLPLQMIHLHM
jgi:hypothetical protein